MAGFSSSRGSIADRMRSLEVADLLLLKQDGEAAMAAADPATPAGAALANVPSAQTPVPPQTNTKQFIDIMGSQLGEMGAHLGSWPQIIAQLQQNGMSSNSLATMTNAVEELRSRILSTQRALSILQEDPEVAVLMNYDAPVDSGTNMNAMMGMLQQGGGM
jgi:hypothetical protein